MAERHRRGFSLIVIATGVAGIGGYAITTIAARGLGPREYATFAVFWAALYLAVGALSGVQQEAARASHPSPVGDSAALRVLILGMCAVVAVVIGGLLLAGGSRLFPTEGWMLALPLLVGPVLSVAVAAATGVLYGVSAWRAIAVVIVGDVALRLVGILAALLLHTGMVGVAWATVVPFGIVTLGLGIVLRPSGSIRFTFDARRRHLAANILRTVGGGIGISLLVSGFPLAIRVLSSDVPRDTVGVLVYALTLTRAPLVVSVLALQSFLVVVLRERTRRLGPTLALVLATVTGIGVVLAAIVFAIGAPIVVLLAGPGFAVAPLELALLVLVSVATAGLAVTGSAVLARGLHGAYVVGWTVAAAVSVGLLVVPGDLGTRVIVALGIGPLVGVALHIAALTTARRAPSETSPPDSH